MRIPYTCLLYLSPAGVSLLADGLGVSRDEVLHAAGGGRDVHHHHVDAALQHEVWEQQPVLVEVPVGVR
jgi:ABC-type hemin transport system substrate-binding protein